MMGIWPIHSLVVDSWMSSPVSTEYWRLRTCTSSVASYLQTGARNDAASATGKGKVDDLRQVSQPRFAGVQWGDEAVVAFGVRRMSQFYIAESDFISRLQDGKENTVTTAPRRPIQVVGLTSLVTAPGPY